MANLRGDARSENIDEKDGKVVSFEQTTVITDPDSPEAVQIPEGVSGESENPLGVHQEPSPNEVFEKASKPAAKSKSSKSE